MLYQIITYTPMYVTFFWAIVLFTSPKQKNRAKSFLGIFMSTAFFLYLSHAVFFNNHRAAYLYLDSVYTFSSLMVYPLYYLYIRLLTVDTKINSKQFLHLIPAAFFALSSVLVYAIMSPAERMDYINYFLFKDKTGELTTNPVHVQKGLFYASRLVFSIQILLYVTLGSKLVVKYNHRIANFYSNLERKTIVWVNFLLYSFVATSIMSIIFNILGKAIFFDSIILLLIPSVIFSALLFVIGLQGYMQNHTVVELTEDENFIEEYDSRKTNTPQLKDNLLKLFSEEHIYKRQDLKITQISSLLKTNRTYVSNLINTEFACSFSDFVNRYRIEEAKRLLLDSKSENYSLEHISESSGFGSLHSFIRVFKIIEGITPGKYRDMKRK